MIVWGMATPEADTIRTLRKAVRIELTEHGMTLRGVGKQRYSLQRHREFRRKTGKRDLQVCRGTIEECCRAALELIEPHNYPAR